MRLGILADIHEEVDHLQHAVDALQACSVDQFVILGDIFEMGRHINETVAILSQLNSVGVWGNHDFRLCCDVSDSVRQRYSPEVISYFASLKPWLEIEGCRFQHIEPFLDSNEFDDLWAYGSGSILNPVRSFDACPNGRIFMGHVHRWELLDTEGTVPWNGCDPIHLDASKRYLAVIHAVQQGWCALFDTETDLLVPLHVG